MHIIMVQTLKIGEMRGNLRKVTVCVSIVLVETEWFGSLNYITVLVHVTGDMRRCHEEYLNTHNLLTSIAVPSLCLLGRSMERNCPPSLVSVVLSAMSV